jgi:hypothetical protein
MIWIALVAAAAGCGWLLGTGSQAANLEAARAGAPLWGAVLCLGLTGGGYGRERVRRRLAYASPTRAWLAKVAGMAGLIGMGTFAGSPVAWDPSWLPWMAGLAASGIAGWVSNLPRRL